MRGFGVDKLARSKRHHYVPQALQRSFVKKKTNRLWYAHRGAIAEDFLVIEERNTISTFQERDFYTVIDSEDRLSDEVERNFFADLDNKIAVVVKDLIEILNSGKTPIVDEPARSFLKIAFYSLFIRTKDIASARSDSDVGNQLIEDIRGDLVAADFNKTDIEDFMMNMPDPKKLGRSIRARAQSTRPPIEVMDAVRDYQFYFVKTCNRCSFVLGSKIVYRISNGTNDKLGSPNVELWMIISPKYAMVMAHETFGRMPVFVLNKKGVSDVNETIRDTCLSIASRSLDLLGKLLPRAKIRFSEG